jgi:hypothetical protein
MMQLDGTFQEGGQAAAALDLLVLCQVMERIRCGIRLGAVYSNRDRANHSRRREIRGPVDSEILSYKEQLK